MKKRKDISKTPKKWVFPVWMEKYRDDFMNTGGNEIEDLMNDHETNVGNNSILCAIIVAIKSQEALLRSLHKKGMLK